MDGYGLRYYADFDSFKGWTEHYRLNIFLKGYNYPEQPASRLLFSAVPVVQEWQDDDPKQPIRGCTLDCKFITEASGVHLSDFYSEDDLQFYCEFRNFNTDQLLFAGFLLQDDCAEIEVDFNHEIRLLFTDMLGTLKDVTLDQAAVIVGQWHTETGVLFQDYSPVANNTIQSNDPRVGVLKNGDVFKIVYGGNTYTYTCYNITYSTLLGYLINIGQSPNVPNMPVSCDFIYKIPYPLVDRVPIIDLLKLCIQSTYIQLPLKSYVTICPEYQSHSGIDEIWQETYVNIQDYYQSSQWINCYDLLVKIFSRLGCSLFQCDGFWTIIRWAEIYKMTRTSGAVLNGHYFDLDFNYIGQTSYNSDFNFHNGSDMETGVVRSLIRPKQYVKETMNYQIPELLKNKDLNEVGALINQYTVGTDTYYEYELPYWVPFSDHPTPEPTRFIRVIKDQYQNETDRYIVLTGSEFDATKALQSNNIELSWGDNITWGLSFRTTNSLPGPATIVFAIALDDGINPTHYYSPDDNGWHTTFSGFTLGYPFSIGAGDNLNQWHNITIKTIGIPFDGIIRVFLANATGNTTDQTFYKGFSFTRDVPYSGHVNKDSQNKEIKNNADVEIFIDNTPRSSIVGSLFNNDFIGIIRQRVKAWKYPGMVALYYNLGIATTQEEFYQNYIPRAKYEGNLLYVKKGIGPFQYVNPLSVFNKIGEETKYRFVPGKVTVDYKNASVDLTLYELISNLRGFDDEGDETQYWIWVSTQSFYEFIYLYNK